MSLSSSLLSVVESHNKDDDEKEADNVAFAVVDKKGFSSRFPVVVFDDDKDRLLVRLFGRMVLIVAVKAPTTEQQEKKRYRENNNKGTSEHETVGTRGLPTKKTSQ